MFDSNYKKIYTGNIFVTQQVIQALEEVGITPVVKDNSESARLAGFGTITPAMKEVFVHNNEYEKAIVAVQEIIK